jgi:hypothetical protein
MNSLRRGSTLLAVTLMGVLILSTGLVLVSVAVQKNKESYGLNRQVVCRYAAEGILHEVMFRAKREEYTNTPGWFSQAKSAKDPVLVCHVPAPLSTSPVTLAGADSPEVSLSIYDAGEAASRFDVALGTDEYIVEARAALDGFISTLHMRVKYGSESAGGGGGGSGSGDPLAPTLFSKYHLWTRTQVNTDTNYYFYGGSSDGLMHFDGDVRMSNKNSRFAMPLTATGVFDYLRPPYMPSEWTQAEKDSLFDSDGDGLIGTGSRTAYNNTSEADALSGSGGGKPSVTQPATGDVEAVLLQAVKDQRAADPALDPFWIDPVNNPLYKSGGAMRPKYSSGAECPGDPVFCDIKLTATTTGTQVMIKVHGSKKASSTAKYPAFAVTTVTVPLGKTAVVLTPLRINDFGGTYNVPLTVASTYERQLGGISQYGKYNDSPYNFPKLQVQYRPTPPAGENPSRFEDWPSIRITDHVVAVDKNLYPKFWIYGNSTSYTEANKPAAEEPAPAPAPSTEGAPPPSDSGGSDGGGGWNWSGSAGSGGFKPATFGERMCVGPGFFRGHGGPRIVFAQDDFTKPFPIPGRLSTKIKGIPVSDIAGDNVDTDAYTWSDTPRYGWKLKRNPNFDATHPVTLGIYSRGTAKFMPYTDYTGYISWDESRGGGEWYIWGHKYKAYNHIGVWAFYGGGQNSRIYGDVNIHYQRAHAGSTVSPKAAVSTYRVYSTDGNHVGGFQHTLGLYDWDLMKYAPPKWPAPLEAAAGATTLKVSFGAIYEAKK